MVAQLADVADKTFDYVIVGGGVSDHRFPLTLKDIYDRAQYLDSWLDSRSPSR